jgi:hypothetical protein
VPVPLPGRPSGAPGVPVPPPGRPSGAPGAPSATRMAGSGGPGVRKRSYSFSEGEKRSHFVKSSAVLFNCTYISSFFLSLKLFVDPSVDPSGK